MSDQPSFFHPSPQLCKHCKVIPWPRDIRYETQSSPFPHHRIFDSLQSSADAGCIVCQYFWLRIISMLVDRRTTLPSGKTPLHFYIRVLYGKRVGILVDVGEAVGHDCLHMWFLEPNTAEEKILEKPESRHIKQFSQGEALEDLEDLVKTQIQPWIEACYNRRENHENCGRTIDTNILPTRLIDVGTMNNESVRLITTMDSMEPSKYSYLILSYCWGRGNDVAKTTTGNLEDRLRSLDIAYLPKTIQDAIILTRMMNIRYLWVDAICIIQSSENDNYSEFQTEASRMRDYYTNAQCCIAASVANDAAEGFLRERLLGRYPIQSIFLTYAGIVGPDRQSITLQSKENVATLRNVIDESPLSKRGWCLQELSLPPRVLHWTSNGLYCECQSSYFLEGSPKKWETYDYAATATPRDILAMPNDKLLTHDGWHRLLQRLQVEYFNGVFRPYLAQGLAWNYSPRGPYDTLPDVSVEPRDERFPTWCWASNGPVQFSDIPTGDSHSHIHDVHPHTFPSSPGNTNLTDVIESKLHIKAPVIQVDLVYEPWKSFPPSGNVSINCDGREQLDHYFWVWLDNQLGSNHSTATNILHNASHDTLLKGVTVQVLLLGGRQSHTHFGLLWLPTLVSYSPDKAFFSQTICFSVRAKYNYSSHSGAPPGRIPHFVPQKKNCEESNTMSANTTASQHNGMEFLKGVDTADKKIQVNTTPPLPIRKYQSITGNTKTLHRFGEFPREIQIKIFKLALPDPRIVYLRLEIIFSKHEEGITWVYASSGRTRASGLLSLLETCTISNASVYSGDGFTKAKLEPLGSRPHTANKQHLGTDHYFGYKNWGDKVLNYTYMRPTEDILVVNYDLLSCLYGHNGSLNLEKLTHIAAVERCLFVMPMSQETQCYWNKDERQVPSQEADDSYRVLEIILKARYLFDRHFDSYRREVEEEGNKDAIEYWKKVEVVNALHC
ncbi:putative heterokaryon incompatibility protein [Botrytis fragariae]|uniref:Putative heterokaryon incompatibility protein n=1 Tax=Botrytis fragariae TaxID=1964551 RepID=A0A8H6AWT6_9HELO|nr:putative heterokaryon incompatibility protein [Botrytis fragariae]KAF5875169.1 putative heterokaryon incompatibility protein [Botrytis fragariae]